MKKLATYGAGLIALYLVVDHWVGTTMVGSTASNGIIGGIKALQGRG